MGVFLAKAAEGFLKGIGGLLGFAAKLEEEGKDKYVELGEIAGRTKSGKDYAGAYGLRMKIGINPEEFRGQKKLRNIPHDSD
mgnify:FL=1